MGNSRMNQSMDTEIKKRKSNQSNSKRQIVNLSNRWNLQRLPRRKSTSTGIRHSRLLTAVHNGKYSNSNSKYSNSNSNKVSLETPREPLQHFFELAEANLRGELRKERREEEEEEGKRKEAEKQSKGRKGSSEEKEESEEPNDSKVFTVRAKRKVAPKIQVRHLRYPATGFATFLWYAVYIACTSRWIELESPGCSGFKAL